MPFGAQIGGAGETRFRLWAPRAQRVELCIESDEPRSPTPMASMGDGWYELELDDAAPGTLYRFLIDSAMRVSDPASRFQPQDVHGPSEVIDPLAYVWSDEGWRGRSWEEAVIYELHVGAFTPSGTFAGVVDRFDHLAALGVTAVELMPVADTPGWRSWGYDGVYLFAPDAAYGRPEDLKALVDAAHQLGLMVFLDVVYNHFGPEGNYLHVYAPQFFTDRHRTPWGAAVNFDGGCRAVREFFIHNALYWIEEYHLDGLRLDAVHAIHDRSAPEILIELADAVHQRVGEGRRVHLVLENDDNASRYLARDESGRPRWYVAQWNDDLHHAFHVLLTGEDVGYYSDYTETPARHLGRALTEGFAYQGERSRHRGGVPRGEPSAHLPAISFVSFLQNHDQVGNRAFGERISTITSAEAVRAAMAAILLAPSPPLLFMGEEWGSTQPFPFFCDFGAELAEKVREGRRQEFARFPEFRDAAARARIPDPNVSATFAQAVLDWSAAETEQGRGWLSFYRKLLDLRRREIIPRLAGLSGGSGEFAQHGQRALTVRWRLAEREQLWLGANLGPQVLASAPKAPPWRVIVTVGDDMAAGLLTGRWPPWSVAWLLSSEAKGARP